ncbi:MAG: T9SS type A sorting domain-containing protein [Ignavibacteria bacterium]|nr:T9SS type A sorting domain-containing protein [Ignavibacteria bacterium]
MFKILLYFFVILVSVQHAYSQAGVKWIKQFVSGTNEYSVSDVTTDNSGSVYITGSMTIDAYNTDVFTAKYDSLGNMIWSKTYNHSANGQDGGVKILADNNGNVFVACYLVSTARQQDWGLIKYNATGAEEWVTVSSSNVNYPLSSSGDSVFDAEFDNQGNIVIGGEFATENAVAGYPNFAVVKYNPVSGAEIWRNSDSVDGAYDGIRSIAIDNAGNIYGCGHEMHGSVNGEQMVIRKYSPSGIVAWTKLYNPSGDIGSATHDFGIDVEVDAAGNIYGLGVCAGGGIGNERNVYVIKLSPSGSTLWDYTYGQIGLVENAVDGWAASNGNYYFTLNTVISASDSKINTVKLNAGGTLAWNNELNETPMMEYPTEIVGENNPENVAVSGVAVKLPSANWRSLLLLRYDSPGALQWRKKMNFSDGFAGATLSGVAIGSNHNVYSAGQEGALQYVNAYTLRVMDATVSQSATVNNPGLINLPNTALEINVESLTGSGLLTGSWMNNAAGNVSFQNIAANFISPYRWVIALAPTVQILTATIYMILSQIPGGSLINNPATVSIYKRVQDGLGAFVKLLTTYAGGRLFAQVNGFSEFILGSMTDPILVQEEGTEVPEQFELRQNYPNPFNPATNIGFSVPEQSHIKLVVYDNLGREVATLVNERLNRGNYYFQFSGEKLASGVYFYKLVTENTSYMKKMVLVK